MVVAFFCIFCYDLFYIAIWFYFIFLAMNFPNRTAIIQILKSLITLV